MKRRLKARPPNFYESKSVFTWDDKAPQPNSFIFKAEVVDSMIFDCTGFLDADMKTVLFNRVALFTSFSRSWMPGSAILRMPPLWQLGLIALHTISYDNSRHSFELNLRNDEIDEFFPTSAGDQIRARILAKELEG